MNQYKFFRSTNEKWGLTGVIPHSGSVPFLPGSITQVHTLSKRYDEPTYMTFRVLFGQNSANRSGTNLLNTDYDRMPHPLFINQRVDSTQREGSRGRNIVEFNRGLYSTRDYLRDSNEFTRAEMLKEFIELWEDLQKNFQWYFRSIEGLADLLRVEPERGQRVGNDVRLTFNMAEGVDQRVSYLLNLYRKIAWDDIYQRWVLPDMMRFFDIQIYITEFRTFHQSSVEPNSNAPVYLQILNGILPTYLIECEMCEFDIKSFNFTYRDNVNINEDPTETTVNFQVKVGNVHEVLTYPLFSHFIFDDFRLSGLERSKEFGLTKDIDGRVNPDESEYISTKSGDLRYRNLDQRAQDTFFHREHESGKPFLETNPLHNINNARPENYGIDLGAVNPLEPATWVGNAITFGKSFTTNFITQRVDKAKMTNIPGLGFSFNEAVAAIQSKSFISVLALIRRAIADTVIPEPSSQLDKFHPTHKTGGRRVKPEIEPSIERKIDEIFTEFLEGVVDSQATEGDAWEFVESATKILSNRGVWEEVKDLSYATDLVGPREVNIPVEIEGADQYRDYVERVREDRRELIDTGYGADIDAGRATSVNPNDLTGRRYVQPETMSSATQDRPLAQQGQIIEAAPSSATTGRRIQSKLQTTKPSVATDQKIEKQGPTTKTVSEATANKNIKSGEISGGGELGSSIEKSEFSGEGEMDRDIKGGEFSGEGEMNRNIQGGKFIGSGGLKDEVEGERLETSDTKSAATEEKNLEKLDQPLPSKATRKNIE